MRSVNVRLREEELRRLVRLALTERRRPADQAAVLIAEGLKQAGAEDRREAAAAAVDEVMLGSGDGR